MFAREAHCFWFWGFFCCFFGFFLVLVFLMFLIPGWLDLDGGPVEAKNAGCPTARVQLFFDFFFYAVC